MPAGIMLVVRIETLKHKRLLLAESTHVAMPTERRLVGNAVIDTYVQRTPPVK